MQSGIYKIENLQNGKLYIGSAVDVVRRKREHLSVLRRGIHWNYRLQKSWNKYGEESFKFSPMIICSKENLIFYEQLLMDGYGVCNDGYNLRPTAESCLGHKHSEKSKENFRKGAKGRIMPPMSDEAKRNKSIAMKNRTVTKVRVWTDEDKEKYRQMAKKLFTGKKLSDEHKEKLRQAKLGRKLTQEHKDKIRDKQLAFRAKKRGEA